MKKIFILYIWLLIFTGCFIGRNSLHKNTKQTKEELFKNNFSEAEKYYLLEQYDYARKYAQEALKYKPNSAATYYIIARSYIYQNNLPLAFENAKKTTELNPKNLWYWRLLAKIYYSINQFNQAIKIYKENILPYSEIIDDWYNLVDLYKKVGRTNSAIATIKIIRQKEGTNWKNINQALILYSSISDTNAMINEYKNILHLYGNNPELLENLLQFAIYTDNQVFNKYLYDSLSYFTDLIAYVKLNSAFYYLKKDSISECFNNLKQVFDYEYITDINKYTFFKIFQSHLTIEKCNNYFDSLYLLFSTYIKNIPEVYSFFGEAYFNKEHFYKAKNIFQAAFKRQVISLNNTKLLSWIYVRLNMFDTLNTFVDSMLTYYPINSYLYYYKSLYYLKKHKPDLAQNYIEIAQKYNVNDFKLKAMLYYLTYLTLYLQNDTVNAQKYFDLTLNNINRDCYNLMYFIFLNTVLNIDLQKVNTLSLYCKNDKYPEETNFIYAFYYYRIADYDNAKKKILKSLQIEPENPLYNEFAYYVFKKLNDIQKTNFYKQKAIKLGAQLLFLKE